MTHILMCLQRIAYVKEIEAENDSNAANDDGGMRAPPAAAASRVATSSGARASAAAVEGDVDGGESIDDSKKAIYEARKKEEEEFAKLEAAFIAELELKSSELPEYAKHLGVDAPADKKAKDGKK